MTDSKNIWWEYGDKKSELQYIFPEVKKTFAYKPVNSKTVINNLLKLKQGDNLKVLSDFIRKDFNLSSYEDSLSDEHIEAIANKFKPSAQNRSFSETAIESVVKTHFNEMPKSFINTSVLNLVSQLFFTFDIEPFVLFNIVDKSTLAETSKIFRHVVDQEADFFIVNLIFDKRYQSMTPLLYVSPYMGVRTIKGNNYPSKFVDQYEQLNKVEHVYLPNFEEFSRKLIMKNMNKIDLSSKSKRLHFVRKYICNFTQNEFSKLLREEFGVKTTSSTISRWENDHSENPIWYRNYKFFVLDVLKKSENIFGLFGEHYGWEVQIHDEVIEDLIEIDDYNLHRHVIDPTIQILAKNYKEKKNKEDLSILEQFKQSYNEVSHTNKISEDYELTPNDVISIINYLSSTEKRILFADMKNAYLAENEMLNLFKIWKNFNKE